MWREVLVTDTVVMEMKKELLMEAIRESLCSHSGQPLTAESNTGLARPCMLPVAEPFDILCTIVTLSHKDVKSCLFKVTKPGIAGSSSCLNPLAPALINCLPLQ